MNKQSVSVTVRVDITFDVDEILSAVPEARKEDTALEIEKQGLDEWIYEYVLDSVEADACAAGVRSGYADIDDCSWNAEELCVEDYLEKHPWLPGGDPALDIRRPYDVVLPFNETEIKLG